MAPRQIRKRKSEESSSSSVPKRQRQEQESSTASASTLVQPTRSRARQSILATSKDHPTWARLSRSGVSEVESESGDEVSPMPSSSSSSSDITDADEGSQDRSEDSSEGDEESDDNSAIQDESSPLATLQRTLTHLTDSLTAQIGNASNTLASGNSSSSPQVWTPPEHASQRHSSSAASTAQTQNSAAGVVSPNRKPRGQRRFDASLNQAVSSNIGDSGKRKSGRPFLSLPRELRDQIYRELLVHDHAIAIRQPKFHVPALAHPSKPLAIIRTNHQVCREAMEIYITENSFVLDLNILTAIDFLAAMPTSLAMHFNSITLGKAIMSGYVRYDLGMFDSSRLRGDLVKRLVYDFNLKSISIEVPDEHNPTAQGNGAVGGANGGGAGGHGNHAHAWFNLSTFHPRHDYSWSLMRELTDVLLESGFQNLRLVYANPIPHDIINKPKSLLNLYAVSRILYMDDEFEVETQVKRIEMARLAGRRDEFADKKAVERYVRSRRQIRRFEVGRGQLRDWESGSAVVIRRAGAAPGDKAAEGDKMWDVRDLLEMEGPVLEDTSIL